MLVLSNLSFCHNVFKSRLLQRHLKASVIGIVPTDSVATWLDQEQKTWVLVQSKPPFLTYRGFLHDTSAADKFCKNIVRKGENAHKEQFLLLRQCFQLKSIIRLSFIEVYYNGNGLKKVVVTTLLGPFRLSLILSNIQTGPTLTYLHEMTNKTVWYTEQFLLLPQCFQIINNLSSIKWNIDSYSYAGGKGITNIRNI